MSGMVECGSVEDESSAIEGWSMKWLVGCW